MLGLDYSAGRPRGSEVKRLGYDFVIRYCGQPGNKKNATRAEVDDMIANGVAVALVFESTAARAGQGFDAGVADARAATAHQAALGIPASRPIYYAVDYDADPVSVEPYFQGVNSVPGPDSAYGSFRVVRQLRADGLTVDSWQTVAWSHGQIDDGHDVFQRLGYVTVDGVQCDVNEAFTADFGQYPAPQEDAMTDINPSQWLHLPAGPWGSADGSYAEERQLQFVLAFLYYHVSDTYQKVAAIEAKVNALAGTLSDDETNVIAAIRAQPTGSPVDVAALAAALGPVMAPLIKAGVTVEQVKTAVREVFAAAGHDPGSG